MFSENKASHASPFSPKSSWVLEKCRGQVIGYGFLNGVTGLVQAPIHGYRDKGGHNATRFTSTWHLLWEKLMLFESFRSPQKHVKSLRVRGKGYPNLTDVYR